MSRFPPGRDGRSNVDEISHPLHRVRVDGLLDDGTAHDWGGRARCRSADVHQLFVDSERGEGVANGSNFPDVVYGVVGGRVRGGQQRGEEGGFGGAGRCLDGPVQVLGLDGGRFVPVALGVRTARSVVVVVVLEGRGAGGT